MRRSTFRRFASTGRYFALVSALSLGLVSPLCFAAEAIDDGSGLEAPIEEVHSIVNEFGETRILLRPADLSAIDGEFVISATLEIPLAAETPEDGLAVSVYSIDREWSNAATWTTPWANPGGDVFEDYVVAAELAKGDAPAALHLDVSEMVRAMADGDVGKNGFIVTASPSTSDGLDSDDLQTLGMLEGAKLYVDYRKISLLGFPKEGSKALWKRSVVADGD